MKNQGSEGLQLKIYLRENEPSHKTLKERCENRNRQKYRSVADYLAAATEKLESLDTATIQLDLNNLSEEEMDAYMILLRHRINK